MDKLVRYVGTCSFIHYFYITLVFFTFFFCQIPKEGPNSFLEFSRYIHWFKTLVNGILNLVIWIGQWWMYQGLDPSYLRKLISYVWTCVYTHICTYVHTCIDIAYFWSLCPLCNEYKHFYSFIRSIRCCFSYLIHLHILKVVDWFCNYFVEHLSG